MGKVQDVVKSTIRVSVSGKSLEDTAREDGRFQQSGGKWVMLGRLSFEGEVREVKGWNWEGLPRN